MESAGGGPLIFNIQSFQNSEKSQYNSFATKCTKITTKGLIVISDHHPLRYVPSSVFCFLTLAPSHLLTFCASHLLTFCPSHLPTFCPSHLPTFCPSHLPTFSPSVLPTFSPSHRLTFLPSHRLPFSPSVLHALPHALSIQNPNSPIQNH
jgi:hypothetical protein